MKPPICRLCKNAHWPRAPHRWGELPDDLPVEPPRSPDPHIRDTPPPNTARESADTDSAPQQLSRHDKPDTAPSADELRSMSNDELRLRYNAIMSEKMRRQRAKQKAGT